MRVLLFSIAITIWSISAVAQGIDSRNAASRPTAHVTPHDSQVVAKAAVQRGLQFVRKNGERWMTKRGCVSCHQIPSLLWSHSVALQSGYDVERKMLRQWEDWSTQIVNFVKPAKKKDFVPDETMTANIDTMTHLLLAIPHRTHDQSQTNIDDGWRTRFVEHLSAAQRDDGSWNPCGQLPAQKRTLKETTATTTAWTAIALMRNNGSFDEQAATTLIDAIDNPESTEFLAAKSLLLQQQRADKTKLQFAARQLLNAQNSDGGWGWRLDANSDALGTGIAMYALATNRDHPDVADENETTKSIQRGTEFLLSTQRENGSWSVPGTKRNVKDKPTPTAGDWGTAWAVLALATSQPDD